MVLKRLMHGDWSTRQIHLLIDNLCSRLQLSRLRRELTDILWIFTAFNARIGLIERFVVETFATCAENVSRLGSVVILFLLDGSHASIAHIIYYFFNRFRLCQREHVTFIVFGLLQIW